MLSRKALIRAIMAMALLIIGAAGIATFGKFTLAAVNLVWFKATAGDGEVLVEWLTHSEIDNEGFNLYRTTSEGGPYTRINESLITSGSMGSNAGGYYAYTDNDVFGGITYYYILESVATDGFTELYGPVWATVDGQPTATPSPTPIWGNITDVRMSDTPGGPEMPQFPSGTSVVYVVIDYYEMHGERYKVRVYDNVGTVLLDEVRTFTGSGTESIEVWPPEGGAFPDGRYGTNLYSGMFPIKTILWEIGGPPKIRLYLPLVVKNYAPLVIATPVPSTNTPLPTPTPTVIPARTSHSLSRNITLTMLHSLSTR